MMNRSCSGINWLPPYDKDQLSLMSRCFLEVDDEYTKVFPHRTPARVSVEMTDGTRFDLGADDFRSLTEDEVIERFYGTLGTQYGKETLDRVFESVMSLDSLHDVSAFTELLKIDR